MKKRFYDNGLQFECTGCGDCCRYSDADVFINQGEILQVAGFLELPVDIFLTKFTNEVNGKTVLKSQDDACIFLKNNLCKIYQVRPDQCKTFPFWSEILKSKLRWNYVAELCEGIGQGKLFSRENIRQISRYSGTVENQINGS